jgi:hypothetical protein
MQLSKRLEIRALGLGELVSREQVFYLFRIMFDPRAIDGGVGNGFAVIVLGLRDLAKALAGFALLSRP